jgi:hypothetical protein
LDDDPLVEFRNEIPGEERVKKSAAAHGR